MQSSSVVISNKRRNLVFHRPFKGRRGGDGVVISNECEKSFLPPKVVEVGLAPALHGKKLPSRATARVVSIF
jgi:hypothetical protein